MFLGKFEGWKNHSRGKGKKKKNLLVAHFTDVDGNARKYGVSALNRLLDNPPESFDIGDHVLVLRALKTREIAPR